jgi:crescentin
LNTQRARIEALQARSSTTDKLLDDSRYNLSARAEEIRTFERRFAEATAMRAGVEGKLAQIETGLCERDRQIRDLEQARAVLIERNEALAKSVAGRENAYNRAQERIQGLDERIRELEVELQSTREVHEAEIEDLKTQIKREQLDRIIADGALEAGRKDVARLLRELSTMQTRAAAQEASAASGPNPDHPPPPARLRTVA